MKFKALFFFLAFAPNLHAEDWTTTDGKVYKNVHVVKMEADCLTILHSEGGALVPLSTLPSSVQRTWGYNPVAARDANEKRTQEEIASAAALAQEKADLAAKRTSAVVSTPVAGTTATPANGTLGQDNSEQMAQLENQILNIQSDIRQMARIHAHEGSQASSGAYEDRLEAARVQINDLRQQEAALRSSQTKVAGK